MSKIIAILANIGQLGLVFYLFLAKGLPTNAEDIMLCIVLLTVPVISLLAFRKFGDTTWLGLYLERRRLEEQKKLDALRG